MRVDGFVELKPEPRVEARVSCGCRFVVVQERAIDTRDGRFLASASIVVVPCGDEHVETAREVAQPFVGAPAIATTMHEIAAAMEAAVAA